MRKSLIYMTAAAVVALSSCTSVIKDTAFTTTPETLVVNLTVADIDVAPDPVTTTTTWKWNPFRTITDHKKNADAVALRNSGADVLVEPSYEVEKRGIFRGGSVTVTGHPGKFVNYRNMTAQDAEVINTLKGRVGVATPMVRVTGQSLIDRLRPKKEPKALSATVETDGYNGPRSFLSILGGAFWGDEVNGSGSEMGLMYGRYGQTWGWYTKVTGEWGEDYDHQRGGFTLTGGVIRTLPQHFNVFAGIGVGSTLDKSNGKVSIPVDLGAQWNYRKINLNLGIQANFNTAVYATEVGFFAGVGYNF